jgi:phage antirepressor YoqD-like protein
MNDLTTQINHAGLLAVGGRVSLKDISYITGASYRTVAAYAQKAGWTENGKTTLLDERQTTIILEAMKNGHAGGPDNAADTLQTRLQGIETAQSRAVRIAVLAEKRHELDLRIQEELNAEISELRDEITQKTQKIAEDAPKVRAWERCLNAEGYMDFQETAAVLNIPGLGRNNLFALLRREGVLNRRNIPYRHHIEKGYFRVIETAGYDQWGDEHVNTKTLVHSKGIEFILRLIEKKRPATHTATASAGEALF